MALRVGRRVLGTNQTYLVVGEKVDATDDLNVRFVGWYRRFIDQNPFRFS